MLASIGLTLSGLIFSLLIAIIYFSKKKYGDLENKLYSFLLLWTIFLLVLELYCVFTMKIRNLHPLLNEILCRGYIFGAATWIVTVVLYVVILNNNKKYTKLKDLLKSPLVVSFVLICLVMFIISCFLPITYTAGKHNELYVIGGSGVKVLYVVFAFVGAYLIYLLFRNKGQTSLFKRLPIFFFLVFYFIMAVFQYFYADINDLTFMFGLTVVAIYFTIVSQDYKLVNDLEVASKLAFEANKEKTEFLSKMSHEIRTPMNAIMGFSESLLMDKELTKEKIVDDSKNIYLATNNLIATINNILDVSKIEAGKEVLEEGNYFIGDIIYDLMNDLENKIDKEQVSFTVDFDENIPGKLYGDKGKIHKVLFNLLSNSVKYTIAGDIILKVEAVCKSGIATLKFTVKDTGIGIKEEDYDKLFLKFAKLETDLQGLERGAGLGLNICKSLVDMMGGHISFSSEYGVGTTFEVTINNKIIDYHKCGDIINRKHDLDPAEKKYDGTGKRIMVVDDDKLNLKVIDKLLRNYNFDVTLVESGNSCIELLKKNDKYDLILLDHMMPDLNGIDTIRMIRRTFGSNIPPIIGVTSSLDDELKEEFEMEGFSACLSKPIDSKKLNSLINYYFRK